MIWRLTYCNREGVEARLDIIKGGTSTVEVIEGTSAPFLLSYKMDKSDKSGFFMTSSADISIYESGTFNIDNLKTSSETEIKVEHYINSVLDWSGFVIPDFFSKTLGTPSTVEMVASDRLGTLKSVTLSELNQYVSMRDLVVTCLAKTGLTLPLYTMADFVNNSQTNAFFKALGLAGRLSDTKGRNISCYDVLKSILVASNSKLVQQSGAWYIVNKFQHEQGAGSLFSTLTASTAYSEQTVNFSDVQIGARRTIIPVGATTGVFQEFGGGRIYPDNYNFSDGTTGWTANGGFIPLIKTTPITSYLISTNEAQFNSTISVNPYLFNSNTFSTDKYLQSESIIPYDTGKIEVSVEINATGPMMGREELASEIRVSIGIEISTGVYRWLNESGAFVSDTAIILNGKFPTRSPGFTNYRASTGTFGFKGTHDNPMSKNLVIRIYGSYEDASKREIGYNFVSATFKQSVEEPKGTIYKRTQGVSFTKEHDLDTAIFGDYLTVGLDGAFYQSRVDDTSYLYRTADILAEPLWTAYNDTEQLPLLQHITRQKSRMFSIAHNMISASIDVSSFKPLSIFVDCNSVRHVVVSASYDFLRSEVEVELEQIAYATLDVREFIYSYFGDGEGGISSVGGISGGGGGGGSTAPSYWQLDENGRLFTVYDAYSLKELSAYGFGSSGGGGGGLIETVYGYANLGGTFSNSDLNNTFNAYTVNQLHLRIATLEAGGGSGGSVEWVDILNKPSWIGSTKPSYSWSEITNKPSTFAPSAHTHTKSQITDFAHTHPFTEITGTATTTQIPELAISKITGLQTALNGKFNNPTGTTAQYLRGDGSLATFPSAQSSVTSVGLSAPTGFTVSGSPVTSSGTLTLAFTSGYSLPTTAKQTSWDSHLIATNNPHGVTAGQVGAYALGSNVASATKLQTARTIWGQSFDGTGNVSGSLTNVGNINSILNSYAITDSTTNPFLRLTRDGVNYYVQAISTGIALGAGVANSLVVAANGATTIINSLTVNGTGRFTGALTLAGTATAADASINFSRPSYNYITTPASGGLSFITNGDAPLIGNSLLVLSPNGNVGVGKGFTNNTTAITAQLHVRGNILSTGEITAPKVIFSASGWSMVQTGTELQMQYNGVVKQRYLNDGSIAAIGELTAYAAVATGGSSDFLSKTAGGTVAGAVTFTGAVTLPTLPALTVTNLNATNLVASTNVTTPKVTLGNGWTIEQNATTLTIRKGGVIKYTVNA